MNVNFFESLDVDPSNTNIWIKFKPGMDCKPNLHEGCLKKLSRDCDDELSVRYFQLNADYLLYRKSEDVKTITSALSVPFARLVLPEQDGTELMSSNIIKDKFAIKLCLKNRFSLLFAQNEQEYKSWIEALTKVTIRTDFHTRFTVNRIIGSGAFANVYEAVERASSTKYAVKGFSKNILSEEDKGKKGLWNEISIVRRLDHHNLLRLHEVHETKNSIYLLMDIIEGGDLSKLVVDNNKSGLKESDCISILVGVLRGLDSLSKKKIVHRDLKPSNIMLRKTRDITPDDVVIVDFGLASHAHSTNLIYKRCGTPGFIAPEIIKSRESEMINVISPKSDVFGAGVILYYMMFGKNPFELADATADQIIKRNMEAKIDLSENQTKKYSTDLVEVLKSMLVPNPENRPTAASLMQAKPLNQWFRKEKNVEIDDIPSEICSLSTMVQTIPSFDKHPGFGVTRLNTSTNSRGFLSTETDSPPLLPVKRPIQKNLYKQSLLRSKACSKDQRDESPEIYHGSPMLNSTKTQSMEKDSTASLETNSNSFKGAEFLSDCETPEIPTHAKKISIFCNPSFPFSRQRMNTVGALHKDS